MSQAMRFLAIAAIAIAFFTSCNASGTDNNHNTPAADTTAVDTSAVNAKSSVVVDSVDTPVKRNVTIAVTGDIMTGILYPRSPLPESVTQNVFIDCADILRNADVACGNLEGVLADSGTPRKGQSPGNFSFLIPTKEVHQLVDAGYDFMSVANNHTNDFWEAGMKSTISTLQSAGLGGAGTSTTESSIKEINGVKYGFCA
ncbi:MAG: CapA family protein, partial [Muribaculaceae bacterium]|nr:CapA family protein [Muribaculaceae bacterium]